MHSEITAIFATDCDMGFGYRGGLPWRVSEDLAHFKQATAGGILVMGRATWESMPQKRITRDRTCIIVSRTHRSFSHGALRAQSLPEALRMASRLEPAECFVIGGASLIQECLDAGVASRVLWSQIHGTYACDVRLPGAERLLERYVHDSSEARDGFVLHRYVVRRPSPS